MNGNTVPTKGVSSNDTQGSFVPKIDHRSLHVEQPVKVSISDGSTASYYELPKRSTQLQDLISFRNMNSQIGEIFRACYRYGIASHSSQLRDAKKIKFYAEAEIARLEKYAPQNEGVTRSPESSPPFLYD